MNKLTDVAESSSEATSVESRRNANGQFLPGVSGNPGGRFKDKPITAALAAYIHSPAGREAIQRAIISQVKIAANHPGMATYVRETLEGRLAERLEVSGGLELAARVARARARVRELAESSELDRSQDE
jgi:hypothetical protein